MSLINIVDEQDSAKTARVFGDKALKVGARYKSVSLASAGATAAIFAGEGVLHSVYFPQSAGALALCIYDATTAAAIGAIVTDVQKVYVNGVGASNTLNILDMVISTGLTYRLSGTAVGGVVITYSND